MLFTVYFAQLFQNDYDLKKRFLGTRMRQPRTADLRPHFSLLARTLELVHGDKQILNDLYTFVVHVQAIKYPTFTDFNNAFEAVLQTRNMKRTADTFYTSFLTSVIDISKRGYHVSEAYGKALDMYMNARAAAIFSRLRKLFRGLKGLKTAKRAGIHLYSNHSGCINDCQRSFIASTYLPSPSPSPSSTTHSFNKSASHRRASSAVTFQAYSNMLSNEPTAKQELQPSNVSPSRSRSLNRGPRMLINASNALIELDDNRILKTAFYTLVANYKNKMYSSQRALLEKSTTERLLYTECIIKQRTVMYTLRCGFQTWKIRQQELKQIYKQLKRHNKNFVMLCSLLMRMAIPVLDTHGMGRRDRVILTVITVIFHVLVDKYHTIVSQATLADLHYRQWSVRYLKKCAFHAMLSRYLDLHERLTAPYKYLAPSLPSQSSRIYSVGYPMQTIAERNLALRALTSWKGRLQTLELSFSLMLRVRDRLLMSISFFSWRKVHGYRTLLTCFAVNDANKLVSRAFNAWRQRCIVFVETAKHNSLYFKNIQIQRVVLNDLHRKLIYAESLGNSFMGILQNRRMILMLREWRYALLLRRMERVTASRHNQFLLHQSLNAWRSELLAYRFSLLLDTPYNCSGSYFIKAPPNKQHPTYAALALLALGAMIGDMRPEVLSDCPTLRTIKKIVGLSDYYRHDTRPLKYLKDIDIDHLSSQLAPDSKNHVLMHCFRRWQLFSLMEADKHKNQRYLEAKHRRRTLLKAFQAVKWAARRSHRLLSVQEVLLKRLQHKALVLWRRELVEKRLIEYIAEKHQVNLLIWAFDAWKLRISLYNGLNLFTATLPGYNKDLYDSVMHMLRQHKDPQAIIDHIYTTLTTDPSCPESLLEALDDCLKLGQRGTLMACHAADGLRERSVSRQFGRNQAIVADIFNRWRFLYAMRRDQLDDAVSYHQKQIFRRFFWRWHHMFSLAYEQRSLEKGDAIYRVRLLRHAFMIWNFLAVRLVSNDSRVSNRYLLHRALINFQLGIKVLQFQARKNLLTLRKCIYSWRAGVAEEICYSRTLFEKYFQRKAFRTWTQRLRHLNRAETDLVIWINRKVVRVALRNWFTLFSENSIANTQLENTWRARLVLLMLHNLIVARRAGYMALQENISRRLRTTAFRCLHTTYKDLCLEKLATEHARIKDFAFVRRIFATLMEAYREQDARNCALVVLFQKRFYLRAFLKRTRQERNRHVIQEMWIEKVLVKMAFFGWREQYTISQEELLVKAEALQKRYLIRIWHMYTRSLTVRLCLVEERQRTRCMLNAYTAMLERHQRLEMCHKYLYEHYKRDLLSRIMASWCQAKMLNKHYDTQQRTRFYRLIRKWKRAARENAIYRVQEKRALEWRDRKLLFHAFSEMKVRALTLINIDSFDFP
ncbi:Hypothetical protein GLP15_1090 [Giardia lamblia P15]|uniref:Sfi1 spindle body domain-containing protein n=1 Tax=Giardia intestinalis (strain P15) TaxID=658858 RepID=E1F2L1_GIAIA|nr:Hypothetical protein GLP15_1090 [Giardia lamblia P15]